MIESILAGICIVLFLTVLRLRSRLKRERRCRLALSSATAPLTQYTTKTQNPPFFHLGSGVGAVAFAEKWRLKWHGASISEPDPD
jgi:hypothetical protein